MSPPEAGQGTRKLEDRYSGYEILGPDGDRIGKAGGLFVDEHDGREYVEVPSAGSSSALGTGYYLLPTELCTMDEEQGKIHASVDANTVKNSPYLDSALALSSDHASGVREYYGL